MFDIGPDRLATGGLFPLLTESPSTVAFHDGPMSSDDDDDIEFDFFDEPETVEATQRSRRLPRRGRGGDGGGDGPRRPPLQTPTGFIPLARLVGLIAIAIAVVVALVFWIGACQGKNKHDDYAAYAAKVKPIAESSTPARRRVREQADRAGAEAGRPRDGPAAVRAAGAAGVRPGAADPRARAAAAHPPAPRRRARAAGEGPRRPRRHALADVDEGRVDRCRRCSPRGRSS